MILLTIIITIPRITRITPVTLLSVSGFALFARNAAICEGEMESHWAAGDQHWRVAFAAGVCRGEIGALPAVLAAFGYGGHDLCTHARAGRHRGAVEGAGRNCGSGGRGAVVAVPDLGARASDAGDLRLHGNSVCHRRRADSARDDRSVCGALRVPGDAVSGRPALAAHEGGMRVHEALGGGGNHSAGNGALE